MAGSAGAVRAGRAFVELFTNNNLLYRGLDDAAKRLKSWGASVAKAGAGVGAAGAVLGAPLLGMFKQATGRGAAIDMLGKRLNASAEDVSALQFAFERAGVGIEEFGGVLTGLQQRFSEAADSGDEMLRRMGLNDRGMMFLPLTKQMDLMADAVGRGKTAADKARIAQDLFGESGLKMLDVLKTGSAGLREQTEAAKRFGYVLSAGDAKEATAATRAWTDVQLALKGATLEVGLALLKAMGGAKSLGDQVTAGIVAAKDWLKENRTLVVTLAKLAGGAVLAGGALVAMGLGLKAGGAVVAGLVVGAKLLAAGVGLILSPVGLLTAGVIALGVAWATQTEDGKRMLADFAAGFEEFAKTAQAAWGAVVNALRRGDLEAAFGVITAGIELEWARLIAKLTDAWNAFKVTFKDSWSEVTKDIGKGFADLFYSGPEAEQIKRNLEEDEVNRRAANNAARQADADAAAKRLKDAQKRFNAVVAEEMAKPVPDGKDLPHELEMRRAKVAAQMDNMPKGFSSVKGSFVVASASQQFGYADTVGKRQLTELEKIALEAAELPGIKEAIVDIGRGLRLK